MKRLSSGIDGLNTLLCGGLLPHRSYLVRGGPGSGKTTLGFHFLLEGVRNQERSMFITLGESGDDLKRNAGSIGMDLCHVDILDLSPTSDFFAHRSESNLFTPAEVDRDTITQKLIDRVKTFRPARVFLDSTSHLRYLAIDASRFRQQLLSLIRFLIQQNITLLFTSESTLACPDDDVMYLSDGVITLGHHNQHRTIHVSKFRGSDSIGGRHTMRLTHEGMQVFVAMGFIKNISEQPHTAIRTGIKAIDALVGGGLESGTVTLVTGPAGVGKTTLAAQFIVAAVKEQTPCVIFQFEETRACLLHRTAQIGMALTPYIDAGLLRIIEIDLSDISEDEVAHLLREEVEQFGARMVMFDSVSGYSLCLERAESFLPLRNLFQYLKSRHVTTIALNETQSVTGEFKPTEIGISFMADNIIFLRFLELDGQIRKAIGVLKKRMSDFERHLREFAITASGIEVGAPLTGLRGILQGVPEWVAPSVLGPRKTDVKAPLKRGS